MEQMRKPGRKSRQSPWEVVEMSAEGCSAPDGWLWLGPPHLHTGTAPLLPLELSPLPRLLSMWCLPLNLALLPLGAPGPALDSSEPTVSPCGPSGPAAIPSSAASLGLRPSSLLWGPGLCLPCAPPCTPSCSSPTPSKNVSLAGLWHRHRLWPFRLAAHLQGSPVLCLLKGAPATVLSSVVSGQGLESFPGS